MSTKFNMQNQFDYAIVGGGCIGVSIALALQREWPNAKIILFEGSETKTASKDTSKIIRTPYIDEEYVSLAEEAKEKWEMLKAKMKVQKMAREVAQKNQAMHLVWQVVSLEALLAVWLEVYLEVLWVEVINNH